MAQPQKSDTGDIFEGCQLSSGPVADPDGGDMPVGVGKAAFDSTVQPQKPAEQSETPMAGGEVPGPDMEEVLK